MIEVLHPRYEQVQQGLFYFLLVIIFPSLFLKDVLSKDDRLEEVLTRNAPR